MNVATHPINVLSLCSGAGGLELGLHAAEPRARTVCYVEREAYAAACLVARMEDKTLDSAPVWSDVATFDATAWRGLVDIVTSGDPCQPNSVAGNRMGTDDERWLLDRVLEIFDESGAHTFFRENVPGNADGQLSVLVPALERMGCTVAAGIFSAAEVGASHRRERLFVLAHRDGFKRGANSGEPDTGTDRRNDIGGRGEDVAHRPERGFGIVGGAQGPGCGGHADGGEQALADPLRIQRGQRPGRERVLDDGAPAGNTEDLDGRREQQAGAERRGRAGPAGTGEAVGNAPGDNLWHGGGAGRSSESRKTDAVGGASRDLPLFAPGPNDPRWPAILESAPHLEPAVCRISARLAYRVDRLRLTGNGVFPLAAAYAYRTLDALLADTRASEHVLMEAAE